ncbi:hypothetical protein AAGG52_00785 [Bacillus licheniformis]
MEWKDVDLKEKTINIKQTMFFEDGKEVIQTTKNIIPSELLRLMIIRPKYLKNGAHNKRNALV